MDYNSHITSVSDLIEYLNKFDADTKIIFNTASPDMLGDYFIDIDEIEYNAETKTLSVCL